MSNCKRVQSCTMTLQIVTSHTNTNYTELTKHCNSSDSGQSDGTPPSAAAAYNICMCDSVWTQTQLANLSITDNKKVTYNYYSMFETKMEKKCLAMPHNWIPCSTDAMVVCLTVTLTPNQTNIKIYTSRHIFQIHTCDIIHQLHLLIFSHWYAQFHIQNHGARNLQ